MLPSFGLSPSLYSFLLRQQQQENSSSSSISSSSTVVAPYHPQFPSSATSIHSFRTFVIERDISCRTRHVSTLSVPLVYLVSRSHLTQNCVEVFIPFGKSVKEDDAAGFVLDVETVEKMDASTGSKNIAWEHDWSALADSASPFFVRDNKNLPSLIAMNNHSNNNSSSSTAATSSNFLSGGGNPTLSRMTLTPSSSLTTNFKGSPVATINVSDLGKNSMF